MVEPIRFPRKLSNAEIATDGRRVVVVQQQDPVVTLWRLPSRTQRTWAIPGDGAAYVEFSKDESSMLLRGGSALRWTRSFPSISQLKTRNLAVAAAHFTPDGRRIIAAASKNIWVLNADTGEAITNLLAHSDVINDLQLSLDGRLAISASDDEAVRVWNLESATLLGELPQQGNGTISSFNPDASQVLTLNGNGDLRIWTMPPTPRRERNIRLGRGASFARWAGDGQRVLTTSNNTAMIWSVRSGESLTAPMAHQSAIRFAEFSADQQLVVTASADHTARLWDARSGQAVGQPFRHAGAVNSAVLSRDTYSGIAPFVAFGLEVRGAGSGPAEVRL